MTAEERELCILMPNESIYQSFVNVKLMKYATHTNC